MPIQAQTASATIAQKALAYGFPGILVDGNDMFAVYAVRGSSRAGPAWRGTVLIEAYTYRMGAHTTADDPTKYRDDAEVDRVARARSAPAGASVFAARVNSGQRPGSTSCSRVHGGSRAGHGGGRGGASTATSGHVSLYVCGDDAALIEQEAVAAGVAAKEGLEHGAAHAA